MNSLSILGLICEYELSKLITKENSTKLKDQTIYYEHEERKETSTTTTDKYNFGHLSYSIEDNKFCKLSKHTGWHIRSGQGEMKIKICTKTAELNEDLIIRTTLVRKNLAFRQYGINKICEKHKKTMNDITDNNVLQPGYGQEGKHYTENIQNETQLCFKLKPLKNGKIDDIISLKFNCNDSCITNNSKMFIPTEASRDLLLVLTLESITKETILAKRNIVVWPKAVISKRDLMKTERRKPKGGAARSHKKKKN